MACYNEDDYQCTYDSNAGAGKDYSNIDTWETDSGINISALGIVGLACYDSQVHDQDCNVNGSTNEDATHYRSIYSAVGCATPFAGKAGTGANFESTSGNCFNLNDAYTRLYNVVLKATNNSTGSVYTIQNVSSGGRVINVVSHDSVNAGTGSNYGLYSANDNTIFYQVIAYNTESRGIYIVADTDETIGIVCCTGAGNGYPFSSQDADGTAILWSSYWMDNDSAFNENNWDAPSGWNGTDEAATGDLGGAASIYDNSLDLDASLDADYLATASLDTDDGDDHTGEGNCGKNPVTGLSATWNPDSFFTGDPLCAYDIAGNERPSADNAAWDVGASEYVVGGASVIPPLVMFHRRQLGN